MFWRQTVSNCHSYVSYNMSQSFHVLKCYKCEFFQVQIVKKSNKWECKMCGMKQSVKHVYGNGSSKDCRIHVQKLNELHINKQQTIDETQHFDYQNHNNSNIASDDVKSEISHDRSENIQRQENKWNKYIDDEICDVVEEDEASDDVKYVLEIPKQERKRKKPFGTEKKVENVDFNSKHFENSNNDSYEYNGESVSIDISSREEKVMNNATNEHSKYSPTNYSPEFHIDNRAISEEKSGFKKIKYSATNNSSNNEKSVNMNNKWAKYLNETDDEEEPENCIEEYSLECSYISNAIPRIDNVNYSSLSKNNEVSVDSQFVKNDTAPIQNTKQDLKNIFSMINDDDNMDELLNTSF